MFSPRRRPSALLVLLLLCLSAGIAHGQDKLQEGATTLRLDAVDATRVANGDFILFGSFLDRFRKPIAELKSENWKVSFNGEDIDGEMSVKLLSDVTDTGVNVVIVTAAVEAIEDDIFQAGVRGVARMLGELGKGDRSAVVAYATTVVDSGGLSPAHNEAVGWLNDLKKEGLQVFLLDAVEKGLKIFPSEFDSVGPNRVLVVVTDGFDNESENPGRIKERIQTLRKLARKYRVRVDLIGIAIEDLIALEPVKQLANYTGGTIRIARSAAEMEGNLGKARDELLGQHVVHLKTLDFDGESDISIKLSVTQEGKEYTSASKITYVGAKKSNLAKYIIIGVSTLVGLLLLLFITRLIRRIIASRQEEAPVETGAATRLCSSCNNQIPIDWKTCQYCEALPHLGKLVVKSSGELNGYTFYIKESLTNIGSAEGNHVTVKDTSVSKRHAGIKVQDNRFELADFGSTNGVLVNGDRITKQFLRDGDVIGIGTVELEFQLK